MSQLAIKIDLSGLTIGDLKLFDTFQAGNGGNAQLVDFLDRVVVGGASSLPLASLPEVVEAIKLEVQQLANPKDGQGKA